MYKGILTGLGSRGSFWLEQCRRHPECELIAFVEPSEANRKRAVEQFKLSAGQVYPDLDAALAQVKADFVLDVTPPGVHESVAESTFKAGMHLLGEKPLSDSFAVAKKMAAAGRKAGLRHMITQNYRFGASPRTVRKAIADDLIGKPGQFDLRFYMCWADIPGSHYVTQPNMFINDMMVHHFDLMRYVLAADPVSVQAITWNHPWGWHKGDAAHAIVFEFEGGLWATHVSVGCAVGQMTSWNGDWRIEGPKGTITLENEQVWHTHLHRTAERTRRQIFQLPMPADTQAILSEFFASIKEKREPECSAGDNLGSLRMVFGAIASAKEGRRMKLKELG